MRQIKTANITVDAFPMATAKKSTDPLLKKDFMEQLESFLAKDKKTETKKNESKEVTTDEKKTLEVDEKEQELDASLHINLIDLNHLAEEQTETNIKATLVSEGVDLPVDEAVNLQSKEVIEINPTNLVEVNELAYKLEGLLSDNVADGVTNTIDQAQVEEFLLQLETQLSENPEIEVKDVIEGLLSENESELGKVLRNINLEDIKSISNIDLEPISTREELVVSENRNLEMSENLEIKEMPDAEVEEIVAIDQTKVKTASNESDIPLENEVDGSAVELSALKTFEPLNRVDLVGETSAPLQSVAQEDFISNIETLMIEETASIDGGEKVTTARIQLTPERLGKVDLQIEINGKELSAKLIVEQKETKEWIDQQVAHLKEKLLTQEITVKDFQVVVHEENLNDAFMNSEENPFFKQKEKDSQARKEQRILKEQVTDIPVQREEKSYSTRNSISILV